MPIPLLAGALAIFGAKKKNNREYAKWMETFPVTEDCVAMDEVIKAAEARYKQEDKEWRETKKIKVQVRINQKRERDTLGDYINDMRGYRKDLICGISNTNMLAPEPHKLQQEVVNQFLNSANNQPSTTATLVPAQIVDTGNTKAPGGGLIMVPDPQTMQQLQTDAPEPAPSAAEKKAATPEKKYFGLTKKQLLIGAAVVAAGGAAIYFMRKK